MTYRAALWAICLTSCTTLDSARVVEGVEAADGHVTANDGAISDGGGKSTDGSTKLAKTSACDGVAPVTIDEIWDRYLSATPSSGNGGCATSGCHLSGAGGLKFSSAAQFATATVNVNSSSKPAGPRIHPGDPEGSVVYARLATANNDPMPPGGPYLDSSNLDDIKGYICSLGTPTVDAGVADAATSPYDLSSAADLSNASSGLQILSLKASSTGTCGVVAKSGSSFTLSVSGTGFESGATLTVGGTAAKVSSITSTDIEAVVTLSTAPAVRYAEVIVTNSSGVASAPAILGVAASATTLSSLVSGQIATSCVSCHSGKNPNGNLNLSSASLAFAALVGIESNECQPTVLVNSNCDPRASASFLVDKISATTTTLACAGTSDRMPPNAALTAAQKKLFLDWIALGAQNN